MTEKTDHPVDQPPEQEPEHGHEHRLVVYSSSSEEGREPPVNRWKDASKIEEIKFDSSRLDKLPFHLLGAGGYEYTLDKTNDEIRENFHRLDTKRRLEGVAAAGPVPAGKTKKKGLF